MRLIDVSLKIENVLLGLIDDDEKKDADNSDIDNDHYNVSLVNGSANR